MKTQYQIHPIQSKILRQLLFNPTASFSKLNIDKIPTDHFNFHLRSLVESGLLEKSNEKNKYTLSQVGKEFANRLDGEQNEPQWEKQAKIGILMVLERKNDNKTEYLIQQRLKQPYFGYFGFPGGKVKLGETLFEAAERELLEEIGLRGKFEIKGYKHKMDYSDNNELLEDKNFFIFKVTNLKGNFKSEFEGGKNIWGTKKEIYALPNLFDGVKSTLKATLKENLYFAEEKYTVTGF